MESDASQQNVNMNYEKCLTRIKDALGITFPLNSKQEEVLECLFLGQDCLGILPTGYGKSLIFQLLPVPFAR